MSDETPAVLYWGKSTVYNPNWVYQYPIPCRHETDDILRTADGIVVRFCRMCRGVDFVRAHASDIGERFTISSLFADGDRPVTHAILLTVDENVEARTRAHESEQRDRQLGMRPIFTGLRHSLRGALKDMNLLPNSRYDEFEYAHAMYIVVVDEVGDERIIELEKAE